ncbi:MAG: hypothetical protein A2534_04360 [Candidatus Magasanikbacteria bacterium RIFOXYD2_FULL_39_9]|uniref:Uncharacterized protein n=1 Tax=Candidatus Magasanikbacteria bacterium RIFOXYD1_FULL_40_23 TaxID=1798705 RepID=A0A1F6PBI2_9BACT|nr:MAG: hypothetical protein A2534_04360 [Candidatus Magasanikbacteria bacterium RIFOXYD2_FULL_39_9]OGH93420.1 MAG: hypothetical protein A2563_02320 [Candidatus Magasanikbacteria bacterium RIFOXYD1_FULL_40_23]
MAKSAVSFYLLCNDFFNPNGGKCNGELVDVGPENGGKYVTRLKCRRCGRIIYIEITDLHRKLEDAKRRAFQDSTRD